MKVLVTGGCGFLGSHVVEMLLARGDEVTDVDVLTYAADPSRHGGPSYHRVVRPVQVLHPDAVAKFGPFAAMIHLAAESHVDVSLGQPQRVVEANVTGTANMLEVARALGVPRIVVMSTDEVTGDVAGEAPTDEDSPIRASSPYSASKAGAELIALAYRKSFDLDVRVVRSTNLYGPGQHPEKFIPRAITKALSGEPIPLFASGSEVRDWLHVEDGARGVIRVADLAEAPPVVCLGARNEQRNFDVATRIAEATGGRIGHIADRPGHDRRYATNPALAESLGWRADVGFVAGLAATIQWYRVHDAWWRAMIVRGGRW